MYTLLGRGPDRRILLVQGTHLLEKATKEDRTRTVARREHGSSQTSSLTRGAQCTLELGTMRGGGCPSAGQLLLEKIQQCRRLVLGHLDLPLTPDLLAPCGITHHGHVVVADRCDLVVLGVDQGELESVRTDGRHLEERLVPHDGPDVVEQGPRQILGPVAKRLVDLLAGVADPAQLQVPALVASAGSASQGDPLAVEVQLGGVEVCRLELDPGSSPEAGGVRAIEGRQEALVADHVLALCLGVAPGGHAELSHVPRPCRRTVWKAGQGQPDDTATLAIGDHLLSTPVSQSHRNCAADWPIPASSTQPLGDPEPLVEEVGHLLTPRA